MSIDASIYDSKGLNAYSSGSAKLYSRDASLPLNATLEDACYLGTLVKNQTQLDATSALSRANAQQFYKFSLSSESLKLGFSQGSGHASARVQILNSSGKVIADSSTFADESLQEAYANATSEDGLDAKSGDYYVKVTYDVTSMRSEDLSYTLSLYSGTRFSTSYQTIAKPQTKTTQALSADQTRTFSVIDALSYSTKATHTANATAASAANIGWIYQDKSALGVTSQLNKVCQEEYYSFTLQQGNNLKFAFTNHSDTQDVRVQILDSSGTVTIADSHGTQKQREAYAALNTPEGLEARTGVYTIKVSYADGGLKKDQVYDFKIYSGSTYEAFYETTAATESMTDALYLGHIGSSYSTTSVLAAYLQGESEGSSTNIMDTISQFI